MKFSEVDNCKTCKNAYDIDIQGDHCFCVANQCYMCANNRKECKDYVHGDVPAGKERWGHLEYFWENRRKEPGWREILKKTS